MEHPLIAILVSASEACERPFLIGAVEVIVPSSVLREHLACSVSFWVYLHDQLPPKLGLVQKHNPCLRQLPPRVLEHHTDAQIGVGGNACGGNECPWCVLGHLPEICSSGLTGSVCTEAAELWHLVQNPGAQPFPRLGRWEGQNQPTKPVMFPRLTGPGHSSLETGIHGGNWVILRLIQGTRESSGV